MTSLTNRRHETLAWFCLAISYVLEDFLKNQSKNPYSSSIFVISVINLIAFCFWLEKRNESINEKIFKIIRMQIADKWLMNSMNIGQIQEEVHHDRHLSRIRDKKEEEEIFLTSFIWRSTIGNLSFIIQRIEEMRSSISFPIHHLFF